MAHCSDATTTNQRPACTPACTNPPSSSKAPSPSSRQPAHTSLKYRLLERPASARRNSYVTNCTTGAADSQLTPRLNADWAHPHHTGRRTLTACPGPHIPLTGRLSEKPGLAWPPVPRDRNPKSPHPGTHQSTSNTSTHSAFRP